MITLRTSVLLLAFFWWNISLIDADLAKPRIEVFKAKRELRLFDGDQVIKTYRVALENAG